MYVLSFSRLFQSNKRNIYSVIFQISAKDVLLAFHYVVVQTCVCLETRFEIIMITPAVLQGDPFKLENV